MFGFIPRDRRGVPVIRTLHRTRGASAVGARHPGETGPFGPYGADEDDLGEDDEDDQDHDDT
jgi:hypothetical protein